MAEKYDGKVVIAIDGDESGFKSSLGAVGVLAGSVTAALAAMGAAGVRASTEFGAAFAKTQTIMDTAAVSVQDMQGDILDLSITSGVAATDVSEAVYQAISGSVATADAANFVSQANKLSVAGFTSLSNATDVLTTTLNAYGLTADKVGGISNVLIQTQNLGKTSVDELANSMGRAISTGSAYSVNLENLSASYVELTRGGIATAEATTYLSGMLNELGDSGSDVGKILQDKTGKSFGQLMKDGWSLADVLQVLLDAANGDAEALMGLWGSQEAGKAANALVTQGLQDFNGVLAQMQREMSGATSTTEDAYDTMTNTSSFINTRFQNSLRNLGIAVGDQLTPPLDNIKTLLTDLLEGAAKLVAEHPAIVSMLTGTAAAAGTLTVAIGGLTVAKKAKEAMDALNLSMNANPAILITTAVLGLGAALLTFCGQMQSAGESVEAFTTKSAALSETIAAANTACENSAASAQGAADAAVEYVNRLAELEKQGLQTAEAQREYELTVAALNALIPDLNVAIDAQTGLVEGGTDALYAQIDAWKDLAVAEAMKERYSETVKTWADATAELYENQAKLSMVEKDIQPVEAALQRNREKQNEISNALNAVYADETLTIEELNELESKYTDQLAELEKEEADLTITLSAHQSKQGKLNEAIEKGEAALAENEAKVNDMTEAYALYSDELAKSKDAQDAQTDSMEAQAAVSEEYAQKITEIRNALSDYEASFSAAGLSIDAFSQTLADSGISAEQAAGNIENYRDRILSATDAISQKSASDMETMISNMQQRTQTYQAWNDNLLQLQAQYGDQLSKEFLAYIRELGPEYSNVIASWLNGSSGQMFELQKSVKEGGATAVESYVTEYGKLPEESVRISEENVAQTDETLQAMTSNAAATGKETGKELVSALRGSMEKELPGLRTYAKNAGDDVGYQFSLGFAGGIRRGSAAVTSAASAVASIPERVTRTQTATHSPSQVAQAIGYWWPAGLAQGMDRGAPLVEYAAAQQTDTMVEASREFLTSARTATLATLPQYTYYENTVRQNAAEQKAQFRASIEVPVYLDNREIARGTARYMGEQMEFEEM